MTTLSAIATRHTATGHCPECGRQLYRVSQAQRVLAVAYPDATAEAFALDCLAFAYRAGRPAAASPAERTVRQHRTPAQRAAEMGVDRVALRHAEAMGRRVVTDMLPF